MFSINQSLYNLLILLFTNFVKYEVLSIINSMPEESTMAFGVVLRMFVQGYNKCTSSAVAEK